MPTPLFQLTCTSPHLLNVRLPLQTAHLSEDPTKKRVIQAAAETFRAAGHGGRAKEGERKGQRYRKDEERGGRRSIVLLRNIPST